MLGVLATCGVLVWQRPGDSRTAAAPESGAVSSAETPTAPAWRGAGAAVQRETGVTLASVQQALLGQVLLSQAGKGAPEPPAPAAEDPQQPERAALDQRLNSAPKDPAKAARLQAELESIMTPQLLDGAAAVLACGSTMCRIEISDADEARAQRATNAVAERVPKTFAGAAVYTKGTGERAVYVVMDRADLVLDK